MVELYARTYESPDDLRQQTLRDHLDGAGALAASFAEPVGLAKVALAAAELHDVGKATKSFQDYLLHDAGMRGSVIHAYQGAFAVEDAHYSEYEDENAGISRLTRDILEVAIASHHGDLPDCISDDGLASFFDRIDSPNKDDKKFHYDEVKSNLEAIGLDIDSLCDDASRNLGRYYNKYIKKSISNKNFAFGTLEKYFYSCLVDADRCDAAQFGDPNAVPRYEADWDSLVTRFEEYCRKFSADTPINAVRTDISRQCKDAASRPTGIYRLSVPTGGGKTLASLRFALHHAQLWGKKHIIYVIPYLSITSQTTATFRAVLGLADDDSVLLEHYSDAGRGESRCDGEITDEQETRRRLSQERWSQPLIVTTMVQFLETCMASRGTKLRKFHNMADSVIIFDEIQSLPSHSLDLFKEIVNFLSGALGTTIVLCTATQPALENIDKTVRLDLADNPELVTLSEEQRRIFRRVNIVAQERPLPIAGDGGLAHLVLDKARENGSCLAIVNLKSEARKLTQELRSLDAQSQGFALVHLSTSMCGAHRNDALAEVRAATASGEPIICVSTQLIEAGVDVSFGTVVRAAAGLGSIVQAAGRCNRNGESMKPRNVYVVPVSDDDEKGLSAVRDIKRGKEIMMHSLVPLASKNSDFDLLGKEALDMYNTAFYKDKVEGNELKYPLPDGTNAYDLLGFNKAARYKYNTVTHPDGPSAYVHCLAQSFRTVGRLYQVIPDLTKSVVVRYRSSAGIDSRELLEQLRDEHDPREKVRIIRRLQDFTVQLFDADFKKLTERGLITLADDDFELYALESDDCYDMNFGVVPDAEQKDLFF
ncbi:CRISPR-associated helicase Cas3' [Bifidobacterium thermophilum]|uniref:CRISPR-associated helicase Cas3' n=1 Tax=Bifidobacterium thermophilum TaxID=33905 RepID=UPI0030B3D60B